MTIITADLESDGIEVTGIAPGQNDQSARCTATATKDGTTVSGSADVTVTNGNSYCPLIVLDRARLSSGTWQVVLRYDGTSASGRSTAKAVVVP
ncbi:hypothetical protein [Microbacterium capsulatum]|uniref:Uncharacterized protein n=1 Tax=Microbacterium capsulatum TaxID=3041921 RepID=A0ABU0XKM8_9MICO|nr:hypothetical protein [Microbacterium sp. ASV81]MDQ4215377.1 hypothetical protein [Microbacterium sp. ASV81]